MIFFSETPTKKAKVENGAKNKSSEVKKKVSPKTKAKSASKSKKSPVEKPKESPEKSPVKLEPKESPKKASETKKMLSIVSDDDILNYDPSKKKYNPIKDAFWKGP